MSFASKTSPPEEATSKRLKHRVLTTALLAAGIFITTLWANHARDLDEENIRTNFRERATYQFHALQDKVRIVEDIIYGLRRAFLAQDNVTREEFTRVCLDITSRSGSLQSLQWVEQVAGANRAAFETEMSAEYGYPITFKQRTGGGSLTTADQRDEYLVIRFAEPLPQNAVVLGYDVYTAPTGPALHEAAITGKMVVSEPFRLAQATSQDEERGIIFILPVLTNDVDQPELRGFVQGVFRVSQMFADTNHEAIDPALHVYYLDEDAAPADRILFSCCDSTSHKTREDIENHDHANVINHALVVGDRRWRYLALMDETWRESQRSSQASTIRVAGVALSVLAALLLANFLRRSRVVEHMVDERTEDLRTNQAELRAIVDNSPNAIWIKDTAGKYLLVNRRFCEIYQRSPEEIIGRGDDIIYPDRQVKAFSEEDEKALQSNDHIVVEGDYDISGEMRSYYTVKFPVRREDGEFFGIGGIATDVTSIKIVERQLAETQKLESLGVLAGGIAHDFNNLLTGVLGNASLIALEFPAETETGESAREIENAARRAAELCRQMLAYSGRGSYVLEGLDVSHVTRDLVPLLHTSIAKKTQLTLDLADGLPVIEADPSQVRQIIMNLVINASEALPETGGVVRVSTSVEAMTSRQLKHAIGNPDLPSGRYVRFSVHDHGTGISPADLSRIFEPFFSTKFTGRGLGLSAVLGIVRSHRGALLVDSKLGEGTKFDLYLPEFSDPQPSPNVPAAESRSPFVAFAGSNLLVVEDEPVVQQLITRVLTTALARFTLAVDGTQALEKFTPLVFDLVILDLTMPGRSGREVLALIRQQQPDVRVLMISGYSVEEASATCSEQQPNGFLQKPFNSDQLFKAIAAILPSS
ncbi:CHASE domain-containing protein [Synoicihabitans lomoniglobus]|uniref:histidine kinase n=1 Tax=Synoicihabitans lomoniglobus TaxID=2909285 RepID=A0AAF0I5S3_9BACT|nr:CHASE domain-containing protein [Opitutaceae bacterium LMO-M01]WED67439.1 CHASE domain-containing protein [Opitutaceae bacterium LMO-M01]